MTTQEFSNTFDTLLNSYATQAAFGEADSGREIVLDEFEKSVLLTQAQDIIVKQYFERTNSNLGFDESERRQIDFSNLVTIASASTHTSGAFSSNSWRFEMPSTTITASSGASIDSEILFILNERLVLTSGSSVKTYVVVPINYREYDRQMSKPFAQPLKKQAWRLLQDDNDVTEDSTKAEIIPTYAAYNLVNASNYSAQYKVRFIRRPSPIVLADFSGEGLSIDGISTVLECELNPSLHMDILNKAVELAFTTRVGKAPTQDGK